VPQSEGANKSQLSSVQSNFNHEKAAWQILNKPSDYGLLSQDHQNANPIPKSKLAQDKHENRFHSILTDLESKR
jgi:hypothetical protein